MRSPWRRMREGSEPEELLGRVTAFGHGTTQATNALIERTGATTGLITTRGFGDTLALQRLMGFTAGIPVEHLGRYSRRRYPDPIVPRALIREVRERVDQAGRVLVPLAEDGVRDAVHELIEAGVETFAVALLWSFRNPAHEERVGAIIRELAPDAFVSLSCQVSPIIGEYERTATTVLNSYLAPKVASYLDRIENLLRDRGFKGKFNVLNSAGGVVPAREAARKPVLLVASGPAGGVMGSLQLAQEIGHHNIITTDMGGTSFDVALVVDGKPLVSGTHEVGGFHLNTPVIDIRAIGAGGGSIARVQTGLLRVGPDSAGAMPGPVCYGRGGKLATVTDADLVLGILDPDNFLGGRMKLDLAGATRRDPQPDRRTARHERRGRRRRHSPGGRRPHGRHVARGDHRARPRSARFRATRLRRRRTGALHRLRRRARRAAHSRPGDQHGAFRLRRARLGHPAIGRALAAAARRRRHPRSLGGARLRKHQRGVCRTGTALRRGHGAIGIFPRQESQLARTVDMRYRRQTHDLMVPVPDGPMTAAMGRKLVELFEQSYEAVYGKGAGFRFAGIELTTFRVVAVGRARKPSIRKPSATGAPKPERRRIFEPATLACTEAAIFQWLDMPAGFRVSGPAVIEHPETTVYVGPGQSARLDDAGNLSIDLV